MKKCSAIMLLLLFLLSAVGGQYLLFQTYRSHIRAQAKQTMKSLAVYEAESLRFSKKDFDQGLPFIKVRDKIDEIIYKGEYFDVKAIVHKADSVILFAYKDIREKELMACYEKSARDDKHSPFSKMLRDFSSHFICIQCTETCCIPDPACQNVTTGIYSEHWYKVFCGTDYPPPRLA